MRKSFFLCSAIGLLAAVSPALVCAQFQPPNPDELKMTSDPKAPGAAAVYLNFEETDKEILPEARLKLYEESGRNAKVLVKKL